ncbi:hypothetical protein [Morganella sp. GD04133]|uniref:hypothetical protein n=1 Tax=Morganella sp. GD04133 TaxID=2975435 RepID=UPI002446DDAA|nr:hypothetical protein [Morganella sp. GD04133]MDH0356522.1 hypothetical protein [Morganella sp. GD04133]
MSYSDIMSTIATIIAFIAIPATYYNGVRVGRVNDKRKEFNAVAEPMLVILEEHIERLKSGRKPQVTSIVCGSLFPQEILSALRRRMPEKQVNEMDRRLNQYVESIAELNSGDSYDSAIKNASALIRLLRLR